MPMKKKGEKKRKEKEKEKEKGETVSMINAHVRPTSWCSSCFTGVHRVASFLDHRPRPKLIIYINLSRARACIMTGN